MLFFCYIKNTTLAKFYNANYIKAMRKYILMVVAVLLFNSCREDAEFFNPDSVVEMGKATHSDTLDYVSMREFFSRVSSINCIDDYLVIAQNNKDTIFQILDMRTDSIVARFGSKGHARNEFGSTPNIVYCKRDKNGSPLLVTLEHQQTKIIDLKKSIDAGKCIVANVIKEKKWEYFHRVYHLDNDRNFVYQTVTYEDPRDGVRFPPKYYMAGKEEYEWNIYPEIVSPEFPNAINAAYSNTVKPKPDGTKVLSVSNFIDVYVLFDLVSKTAKGFVSPNSYTFSYINDYGTEKNIRKNLRSYNKATCVTDNHFLVLKRGEIYDEIVHDRNENGYSTVNIYDWDGNLGRSFVLGKRMVGIAYHEKSNVLYALGKGSKLYKYILR